MAIQKLPRPVADTRQGRAPLARAHEHVLAIDPGFGRCGIALFEGQNLLMSDCIETPAGAPFAERLLYVAERVKILITSYEPKTLVLETLFFSKNQKTAMQVAETRGALILLATEHGLELTEYTPRQVKQAATGNGAADKTSVARMVARLVTLPPKGRVHDDEYDAIAIGLAHAALSRFKSPAENRS